jgi:hypothetical protein
VRRLVALTLIFPLSSCVFLISTPDSADHCSFAGKGSWCGACVAAQCQSEVDHCCGDGACASTLSLLETCTTAHDASCSDLKQGTGAGGAAAALSGCVATHCRGSCEPLSGVSQTSCQEPYAGQGTLCSCQYGTALNDQACSSALYPDTICCAPKGWPAPGQQCACEPIGCNPTADGCICSRVDYSFSDLARECGGQYCCAAADNCRCGTTPCESWQTPVASCSIDVITCADNQVLVSSCSVRQ